MIIVGRRTFLEVAAAGLSCIALSDSFAGVAPSEAETDGVLGKLGLRHVGHIEPRRSLSIDSSPFSVGFEVLDRQCFDPERTYDLLGKLGVKWARCQTGWCRCERERGKYDFEWLDSVVDSMLRLGIQPWFNLGYGNRLYMPDAPDEFAVGWAPVFDDAAMQAWLNFCQAIAAHFSDRVKHWEIWNEPNSRTFWQPQKANPKEYVKLVERTAPVIRKAVPNSTIIGIAAGGIPMPFIEGCLDAGLADQVDVISYHPYRAIPENGYDAEIARLREAIALRRKGVEIWQGENGCPSKGGPESTGALSDKDWSEVAQAKWLLRRIVTDLRLGIPLTSYFHIVDLTRYRGKTNFKGLLRCGDYTPKPSYFAYQCLCALFDSHTRLAALPRGGPGSSEADMQECIFVRDGHAMYAYWAATDLQQPCEPKAISARVKLPEGAAIRKPVLIDPLSGRVYAVKDARVGESEFAVDTVPLLDYPLILTDRAVITQNRRAGKADRPA